MAIRNRLYGRLGAGRARQILATAFPGGSARNEIKRRVLMKSENEKESRSALASAVIDEIVEELVDKSILAEKQNEMERFKKASA